MSMHASPAQISYLSSLALTRVVGARILETLAHAPSGRAGWSEVSNAINIAKLAPYAQEKVITAQPGYYLLHGVVHVVVKSKTTDSLYAKKLMIAGGRASWDYARGAIYQCLPSARLTLQQAKELGHLHGVCMICGKALTDPKSAEAGIGPTCAKKLMF